VIADTATGLAKNVSLVVLPVHRTTGDVTKLKRFACIDGRQGRFVVRDPAAGCGARKAGGALRRSKRQSTGELNGRLGYTRAGLAKRKGWQT
jgi:hypothetical protein